ncbi:MAG: phosphoribosyltransferase [Nitrososphaera sp.]|nr:phosphoribosyltransferase [Nitrososphaera sp.]
MTEKPFASGFEKPEIPQLSAADIQSVVDFCKPAFGFSEWVALRGAQKPYYFNLDKVYAHSQYTARFHDIFIEFIKYIAKAEKFRFLLKEIPPVLGFVCLDGAPAGIVQVRGLLSERLGWPTVLVFPDKRLLRARVIPGDGSKTFPESVAWLSGRYSLLLSDAATTGESIASAAGALRAFGSKVFGAAVVYNRDEGADISLATVNIPLYSLLGPMDIKGIDDELSERIQVGDKETRDFAFVMAEAG